MKLHYLQHIEFEGPANIQLWAEKHDWEISATHLYRFEKPPGLDKFDWLVVMGGPMNIYEEKEYPWLAAEKRFIRQAIENDKIVIGVCLGAQLIADVLGGQVFRNRYKEIGWFPVTLRPDAAASPAFRGFPEEFIAFHWHGDTFSLGPDALMLAESEACAAQAFSYNGGRVLGLQFHLESSPESVLSLIQNCSDELADGQYIQGPEAIIERKDHFEDIQKTMLLMLENMKDTFQEKESAVKRG